MSAQTQDFITSREVLAGMNITYRQLDYWCRAGVLGKGPDTPGSGRYRKFDPTDRRILAVLTGVMEFSRDLVGDRRGASMEVLRSIAEAIRANPDERHFSVVAGRVEPGVGGLAAACAVIFNAEALEQQAAA